jgi:hypothetical protein
MGKLALNGGSILISTISGKSNSRLFVHLLLLAIKNLFESENIEINMEI